MSNLFGVAALLLVIACACNQEPISKKSKSKQPVQFPLYDISILHPERQTGFVNGGWDYDRYKEISTLDAGKEMILADLKGPGCITHIHTTRMRPDTLSARGVVLEIWFDNADIPAVMCPLADFFGDGCNGGIAKDFSTPLIECVPWAYNCYFRMPFSESARVILRNDTKRDFSNYSYVEWESLPEWNPKLGYFHATYRRDVFQLTKETDHTFFELKGLGHIIGRQFSIITNEPLFRNFGYVMEGNNEVDIDGKERQLDYLGTEDSFAFSWGFGDQFTGIHSGMPLNDKGKAKGNISKLSIYRFHNHMPIRFNESIKWHINWSYEHYYTGAKDTKYPWSTNNTLEDHSRGNAWNKALQRDGAWLDYACVFYWYQDQPGGFKHQPLRKLEERMRPLLRSSYDTVNSIY